MNKGLKNEKLLFWNYKSGFESEDSENEKTNFDRFERQLYEKRRDKHGNETIYLQERRILPFERLIMDLGGFELFYGLLGKTITLDNSTKVYSWQDTEQAIDYRVENFLTVEDEDQFRKKYQKERDMQFYAVG
jgi:hypothetical protein